MKVTSPVNFLLNRDDEDKQVVEAPAFSVTKVLTLATPVITAVFALLAKRIEDLHFGEAHVTTMIVAVLGMVALIVSADLIARGSATRAKATTEPAEQAESGSAGESAEGAGLTGPAAVIRLATSIRAIRVRTGDDDVVTVAAVACEQPPRFLCLYENGSLSWEKESDLRFQGAALTMTSGSNGQA
jgi:hypothetical protein